MQSLVGVRWVTSDKLNPFRFLSTELSGTNTIVNISMQGSDLKSRFRRFGTKWHPLSDEIERMTIYLYRNVDHRTSATRNTCRGPLPLHSNVFYHCGAVQRPHPGDGTVLLGQGRRWAPPSRSAPPPLCGLDCKKRAGGPMQRIHTLVFERPADRCR